MKNLTRKSFAEKQIESAFNKLFQGEDLSCKYQVLTNNVIQNEKIFRDIFQDCADVNFRSVLIFGRVTALFIYVDGLINKNHFEEVVLKPLMLDSLPDTVNKQRNVSKILEEQIVAIGNIKTVSSVDKIVREILNGNVAILVNGESSALLAAINGGERRSVNEPASELVIRGPRDGFTEDIRTNISLVRRRIRTTKLKTEDYTIGEVTQTNVSIAYIKGIAKDSVVEEVRRRLNKIKIDGILESGYIEEFIKDEVYTPFPLVQNTERPDVVAANLIEGKVAIFTDNTPFVLIVPLVFWGQIQSNEDYYEIFFMGTFIRWIRLLYTLIALLFPSFYVAVTTFHPQMLPSNLLMSIMDAREGVPFPAFIEALIMEITFEALREAGIRLPKAVGQAVSIVGALVIGQAAVQAGIISAPLVIVVSFTGIASFTIPRYDFGIAVRLLRFPMIFLAGMLGFYGITLGMLGILIHLVSLRSFGVPYFSPTAPLILKGLKDIFIRAPWQKMNLRPEITAENDMVRIPLSQKSKAKDKKDKRSNTDTG